MSDALVAIIRSGRCGQATQTFLGEIFGVAIEHHIDLVPDWVLSKLNDIAEALSRFNAPLFSSRRPGFPAVALILHGVDMVPALSPFPVATDTDMIMISDETPVPQAPLD